MFDVARLLAIVWALVVVVRARAWWEIVVLAAVAYAFAIAVASGITVRSEGALPPMFALMLALIGPTSLPRGALPPLPCVSWVLTWPAAVDMVGCVVLLVRTGRLAARVETLPESSPETARLDGLGRALVLLAVLQGVSGTMRVLPVMLDWGAGGNDAIFEGAPAGAPR